jgi:hypothetical protein
MDYILNLIAEHWLDVVLVMALCIFIACADPR